MKEIIIEWSKLEEGSQVGLAAMLIICLVGTVWIIRAIRDKD
jgi:hypothetical protein